jgi:hypothetical protein
VGHDRVADTGHLDGVDPQRVIRETRHPDVSERSRLGTNVLNGSRAGRGPVLGGETLVGWLLIVIIVLVIIGAVTVVRKVL